MSQEEELFISTGDQIEGAIRGQLFGKACFKVESKAFICFFENEMVFKLNGEAHKEAINLGGSQLFDPSKKNRPMKEWVQVPYLHQSKWKIFAEEAALYVAKSNT